MDHHTPRHMTYFISFSPQFMADPLKIRNVHPSKQNLTSLVRVLNVVISKLNKKKNYRNSTPEIYMVCILRNSNHKCQQSYKKEAPLISKNLDKLYYFIPLYKYHQKVLTNISSSRKTNFRKGEKLKKKKKKLL